MVKTKNDLPTLIIRRVIRAKRDRVFAAWTKPELMAQWFFCGSGKADVQSDFRLGGSYENKMTLYSGKEGKQACGTTAESSTHMHKGKYLEIVPPEKIVFTWSSAIVTDSRVTVQLKDLGDSTELTLTHELLETEDLRQQHSSGWEGCLTNLVNYLE